MAIKVTIYFYNRLFDPLIQGNFWIFIDDYLKNNPEGFEFHLVTYEDSRLPLTTDQREMVLEMQRRGVAWTPLQWHPGSSILNKVADIMAGFRAIFVLRCKGFRHLIAYGSVAGSFCYLYSRFFRLKLFLYSYEPHSEYLVDNKMLLPSSMQYNILHWLERKAANFSTIISSGTRFMQKRLENEWKVKAKFFKIPSVTDCKKFSFDPVARTEVRMDLNLTAEARVLFYPGKFGSLYYNTEIALMFRWLLDENPALHFLILTPQPVDEITDLFREAGVPSSSFTIRKSDYGEVQRYFSAADFGLIAVPAGPSKRFISNIKVGEYLCSGLPFLITRGVSEDCLVAEEQDVGVVVNDFNESEIRDAWPKIKVFLEMDAGYRRERCMTVGRDYRGFESLNPIFRAAMTEFICIGKTVG